MVCIAISLYKERAEASSTPNVRQQWVCNAIEVAAKSENLALLKDVTIWSERFLNDPVSREFQSLILAFY